MRTLDPHQAIAKKFIIQHHRVAGMFTAPGTGKTLTAIRSVRKPCLVLCRRDDFLTWREELYAEDEVEESLCFIDAGDTDLPRVMPGLGPQWFFVTYDLVKKARIGRWLKRSPFKMVIGDEVHAIKRWASARTKAVIRATRHIPRRLGLTGTPLTNKPTDVFSISYFIDDGREFGKEEYWFKKRYFLQAGKGWYFCRAKKAELEQKLRNFAFSLFEDDVLKLPPVRDVLKSAPMSPEQREHTDTMIDLWEAELESGTLEVDQVIVQIQKLKQIATGFMYDEDKIAHYFPCPKLDLLFEHLDDPDVMGEKPKIVVAGAFTAELQRVADRMATERKSFTPYFGPMSPRDRESSRIRFRDDAKCRFFVAQADRLVGMNELICADTMAYLSNSRRVVSRQQGIRRIRRRGSEYHKEITYYDYVTERSIDLAVLKEVKGAMRFSDSILEQLKLGKRLGEILRQT